MSRTLCVVVFGFVLHLALTPASAAPGPATAPAVSAVNTPAFWISRAATDAEGLQDLTERRGGYYWLAVTQARVADVPAMRKSLARARALVPAQLQPIERFYDLLSELQAYGCAGDQAGYADCLRHLIEMRDADAKGQFSRTPIEYFCKLHRFDDAIAWTKTVPSPAARSYYYCAIAKAQAKDARRTEYDRTIELAEADTLLAVKNKDPSGAELQWSSLAGTAAAALDQARVLKWSDHLTNDTLASMHAQFATAAWNAGSPAGYQLEIRKALDFAAKVGPSDIPFCYNAIAQAQAVAGDSAGVAETEKLGAPKPDETANSLLMLQFYGGMAKADSILGEVGKVEDCLGRGYPPVAGDKVEPAKNEVDAYLQLHAGPIYPRIFLALARKGKLDAAATIAAEAPPRYKPAADAALTTTYARIGRVDEAIRRVNSEPSAAMRSVLGGQLAKLMTTTHRLEPWRAYVDKLPTPRERFTLNLDTAETLIEPASTDAEP